MLPNGKSLISSFSQEHEVPTKQIVMVKAPVLHPNTAIYYQDENALDEIKYANVKKTNK